MSTTAETPQADPAAPTGKGDRSVRSLAPLVRRLHFYAGVLVAPFLVVAALTGLAYTIAPQLDQIAYGDQLHVPAVGAATVPLAEQVEAARAAVPDGTVTLVVPPGSADATTRVVFAVPELADRDRTAFVDPYTRQVRGQLTTWFGSTPLTTWLDDLHRNLHLGEVGRLYTELAASWLWVLVLGGVVLWWGRQRGRRRVRRMLHPELSASVGVRRTRSWHASTGLWLAVVLLILSATGLTWSTYAGARFDLLQEQLDATSAEPDTKLSTGHEGHADGDAGAAEESALSEVDTVLAAARSAGLDGPVEITPAAGAGEAWTVAQADDVWPVRQDVVAVDPGTGTVTDHVRFADQPLLARLSTLGVQAHMGVLFGPVNQVVLALTAVGLLGVIGWGYRMWWQRRPTRADRRRPVGDPPDRGAWRHLPPVLLVVGIPVLVALGWAVPLLGWSLLAFLLLDVAIGLAGRRRGGGKPAEPVG
ncbi:PepSY-associated TM helix domain-containing protein [Actinophytocola xanthii]|uniref:Peptidase n=1 Tax=Actinophytocola xanthii TaxID=1912961 RepID=A0A1Q8CW08_9PSEU|nr:PepSY-associated TM helix domain-containing protein [Actinophytocola xanthii]OLF18539.1 peptidase [Actinophytocola xanthii]